MRMALTYAILLTQGKENYLLLFMILTRQMQETEPVKEDIFINVMVLFSIVDNTKKLFVGSYGCW